MNKRYIVLAGVIGSIILSVIILATITPRNPTPPEEQPSTSEPDTYSEVKSQLYDEDMGVRQETDPYDLSSIDIGFVRLYDVTIFGMPNLTKKLYQKMDTITVVQRDITAALLRYGEDHLKSSYKTLIIIPSSIEVTGSTVKMLLNLGETSKKVAVSATILNNLRASVVIGDENNSSQDAFIYAGGIYDTDYGVPVTSKDLGFSIKQQGYTRNLVINASNKEEALHYLSSLGYKVPDFSITFVDYRSPFE